MKARKLKRGYVVSMILPVVGLVLAGCGGGDGSSEYQVKDTEEAVSQLEKEFEGADPETKKTVSQASEALRNKEFERAAENLTRLQEQKELSFDQQMRIENATRELNAEIAEALESEDPQVRERAREALKRLDATPGD